MHPSLRLHHAGAGGGAAPEAPAHPEHLPKLKWKGTQSDPHVKTTHEFRRIVMTYDLLKLTFGLGLATLPLLFLSDLFLGDIRRTASRAASTTSSR